MIVGNRLILANDREYLESKYEGDELKKYYKKDKKRIQEITKGLDVDHISDKAYAKLQNTPSKAFEGYMLIDLIDVEEKVDG